MSRPPWAARRARAAHLLREAPHAEEILVFYVGLVEVQHRLSEQIPVDETLESVRSVSGPPPPLRPERLPADALLPYFDDFVARVAEAGTDAIASQAAALLASDDASRAGALTDSSRFLGRAFLELVLTTLSAAATPGDSPGDPGRCPTCGSRPVVGALRDLPDALGSRSLLCSLCATEWRFDRLRCPGCGEKQADRLLVHTAESVPHVRIDECRSCERYIKTVDLRARGDAIPVVDELATVELDLWAGERGLEKLQRNVLEL